MRRRNQSTRSFVWVALKVSFAMMLVVWCKISPFCQAFGLKGGPAKSKVPSRRSSSGLWMSTSSADGTAEVPQKIAIVGGGLAGLSTAFHLLEKATQLYPVKSLDLSILDSHPVGTGGASAVAGG